jgi:hypothetical protein
MNCLCVRLRQFSKPFSFGSHPLSGSVPDTRRAKPRGLFYLGRTDRVSNEPMFGVAIKKTGCAFRPARELATGISGTEQIGDDRLGHDTVALEIECSPYGSSSPS